MSLAALEVARRCTIDHAALKADPAAWAALRLVGRQDVPAGGPDEPAYVLEHRDCPCGSTLAREVSTAITADTITDEQIQKLRSSMERYVASEDLMEREIAFDALLVTSNALYRNSDTSDADGTWTHWRARCAEILNTRKAVS